MVDTAYPRTRNWPGVVALVVATASLVVSLVSCGINAVQASGADNDRLPVQSTPRAASASEVEATAHVTLPPGTVFLAAAYTNGLETRVSAKFRIPRAELDAFVEAGAFTAALTPGLRAVTAGDNVGGGNLWNPEAAVSVSGLHEQQPTADGTIRSLLLNLDVPATITVYLYAIRG